MCGICAELLVFLVMLRWLSYSAGVQVILAGPGLHTSHADRSCIMANSDKDNGDYNEDLELHPVHRIGDSTAAHHARRL